MQARASLLDGKRVVFTGVFDEISRDECTKLAQEFGAYVGLFCPAVCVLWPWLWLWL